MRKIKILSLVMAILMVFGTFALLASCGDDPAESTSNGGSGNTTPVENKVIIGSSTELSGDFRWPGFGGSSAGASDQDINKLTAGYSTMEIDQNGNYVWNKTVVKSHEAKETANGDYEVTIEINPGLKFSDGTEVKAVNYLVDTLAFSSPVSVQAGHTGISGQAIVGFDSFHAYCGADVAVEGATKEFSGLRLLGDYKFSITISAEAGFYPYYFVDSYGAVSPSPLALTVGEGVEVKDDGKGAYLTDAFYAKASDSTAEKLSYAKAAHITEARYDVTKYAFSGPYTISNWDKGTKEATLKLNPNYAGNFEGQKPSIETLVYIKIISETQLQMLENGALDILSQITGGADTKAALDMMNASNGKFTEVHYQRAGYGKVQFECDFGPTMFTEVRQAITYLLNRAEFAQTFTGGYGGIVHGPYSPDFSMWQAVKDDINLNAYDYSLANAKQILIDGGWIYNSKGEPFVEGAAGVDAVRYKKLTAEEAAVTDGVNKTYASVSNSDGVVYKTVEINGEFYMPLVINWFGTVPNDVTDLLNTSLAQNPDVKTAGMVIRATTGDFNVLLGNIYREESYGYGGTPIYGMYNLATGWNVANYDYAFNWSLDPVYFGYSANKLFDEYDKAFPYYDAEGKHTKMTYEQAMTASGGKLGMDYISMAMVYDATTEAEYNQWWKAYIERWNLLVPDIPLYSNYYYDVFNAKIENYKTTPFFGPAYAIIYANVKGAE